MHRALAFALCLHAATALAAPAEMHEHWTRFWAAKLTESADGDMDKAARIYDELARLQTADADALRVDALLALGEIRKNQGDFRGAQSAYERCRALGASRFTRLDTGKCLTKLRQVLVLQHALRTLPARWSFDDGVHGFVLFGPNGSIKMTDGNMVWLLAVDEKKDRLVMGINKLPDPLQGLRMSVRSEKLTTNIQVRVKDAYGNVYIEREPLLIGASLRQIEVAFSQLVPWNESAPPLDPANIVELILHDRTEPLQASTNTYNIVFDSFELY